MAAWEDTRDLLSGEKETSTPATTQRYQFREPGVHDHAAQTLHTITLHWVQVTYSPIKNIWKNFWKLNGLAFFPRGCSCGKVHRKALAMRDEMSLRPRITEAPERESRRERERGVNYNSDIYLTSINSIKHKL